MATAEPRPDHIALLTRDTPLPLAQIEDEHLQTILKTISVAWQELQALGTQALTNGEERDVNAPLDLQLNHMCRSDRKFKGLVHSVQRGRETMSYTGAALEKRPDLSFIFLHGDRNFPLAVECKIVDHPNRKTVRLYCNNGIARFVCGDYGWARCEAIMLAYVRDGATVANKLTPHLQAQSSKKPDPFLTMSGPEPVPSLHPTAQRSVHQRTFQYLDVVEGTEPGPISLWHLWLPA
jgi:hypothetical protein